MLARNVPNWQHPDRPHPATLFGPTRPPSPRQLPAAAWGRTSQSLTDGPPRATG
jgi:hypothetical protein